MHASTVFACNFDEADLECAALNGALLNGSTFRNAILRGVQCGASNLSACVLTGADLGCAHFVRTNLSGADLTGARAYGVNCWNVNISEETTQRDLIVTPPKEPTISVDDIRVAQFVHLILTNANLKSALDSVTRRGVLVLGRFGGGGLEVLRAVGGCLRQAGYLPIIFEFARPEDRTYTETVRTLAGLARFVVVDLSGPSVPQELYATVPHLKIPFVPILEKGRQPYSMFADLLEYDWVLGPIVEFESTSDLVQGLPDNVIGRAEKRASLRSLRQRIPDTFDPAPDIRRSDVSSGMLLQHGKLAYDAPRNSTGASSVSMEQE
jgi:Pentapeptide repeats (8 copies)